MELFFSVDAFSFINRVTLAIFHPQSLSFLWYFIDFSDHQTRYLY